jgi:hypothetical protein
VEAARLWMNRFRKILVRYEKLESSYLGLPMFACAFIAFRKALVIKGQALSLNNPLAVCCALAQNRIKIHESEFLYPANCIKEPDNRGFFAYICKKSTSATGS